MAKVRIGVIGVGGMGQGHCDMLQQVKEAQLVAICDADVRTAKNVGDRCQTPFFTDYRKLIESGLAEAVLIATPHYFHTPIAIAAFKAGLHVLCEKPIAVAVSDADRMLAAAKKSGRVFGVMFQMRADPRFRAARRLLDEGRVGNLIRANMIIGWYRTQAYYNSGGWRATWKGEGGGVLFNQAPHQLDIFTWLVGLPVRLIAQTRTRLHDIEVEDEAFGMLEMDNGAHAYIYASVNEAPGTNRLEIVGDRGKILIDEDGLRFWELETPISEYTKKSKEMWATPKASLVTVPLEKTDPSHTTIQRNFCRAILFGEELIAPGEEAIESLELADAFTLSSHLGKAVKLPISRAAYDKLLASLVAKSRPKRGASTKRVTDPQHVKKAKR